MINNTTMWGVRIPKICHILKKPKLVIEYRAGLDARSFLFLC